MDVERCSTTTPSCLINGSEIFSVEFRGSNVKWFSESFLSNGAIKVEIKISTHLESSLPLLLSAFSHTEVWHLGLNMLVLWSFTPALMSEPLLVTSPSSTPSPTGTLEDMDSSISAWPYYLTGGTYVSTWCVLNHYDTCRHLCIHGWLLLKGLEKAAHRVTRSCEYQVMTIAIISSPSSFMQSGALMAVVSMVVFNNPDSNVYLIFLPFVPIPASWVSAYQLHPLIVHVTVIMQYIIFRPLEALLPWMQ